MPSDTDFSSEDNRSPSASCSDMDLTRKDANGEMTENHKMDSSRDIELFQIENKTDNLNDFHSETSKRNSDTPATVDVGAMETVNLAPVSYTKENNGITKGVVLNATTFVSQNDKKWVKGSSTLDKTKSTELTENFSTGKIAEPSVTLRDSSGSKDEVKPEMSLLRKVVFGFSFLPSVMFVLCFAIILPCEEIPLPASCVQEEWSLILNDTEITSRLSIAEDLLAGYQQSSGTGVFSLSLENGTELWNWRTLSQPRYLSCRDLDANNDGVIDCLLMDTDGVLHVFNVSDGYVFWNLTTKETNEQPSLPIILSDCNKNGFKKIAVATSSSKIQIIENGYFSLPVSIPECATVPLKLWSWEHDGLTDLVYYCKEDEESETLKVVRQITWCPLEKKLTFKTSELLNSVNDDLQLGQLLLMPTNEGLITWAERTVIMFRTDGTEQWRTSSKNHSDQRFLTSGNFYKNGKQVILISGSLTTSAMVTLLDFENGNETLTWFVPNSNVDSILLIPGKSKDHLLVLLQMAKKKQTDNKLFQEDITNITLLSSNEINQKDTYSIKEESPMTVSPKLVLLQFQKKDDQISVQGKKIFSCSNDESCQAQNQSIELAATTESRNQDNRLTVVIGRTFREQLEQESKYWTKLSALKVDNWHTSTETSSYCSSSHL